MIKLKILPLFALLLLGSACKKEKSDIGRDVMPATDILGATYCDTATIIAYSILDDSLRTDESYTGTVANVVGSMSDPVFGRTDASVYFNFTTPNNTTDIGFGADPKLDSVVLTLAYQKDNFYGDKTDALLFNVYRLTESIYYDSAYYSYTTKAFNVNEDITYSGTGQTVTINPSSDVYDGDTKYAPHLRIRLKNEIGQQFIDDSTHLKNTEALMQFFKGIHITTKNTAIMGNDYGCFAYFDLTSPLSKISIYYHNGTNFTTKKLNLTVSSNSAKFNHYKHDYSTAQTAFTQQLAPSNNYSLGNTNLFLQGMASTKVKIKFPYLKNFSDSGKVAINKAELIFNVDKNATFYDASKYFVPGKVALEGLRSDGTVLGLVGDIYWANSIGAKWGIYDGTNYQYTFPIASSVQNIANGIETDLMFTLRMFQHHTNPARVVFGGKNNTAYPLKLRIWYTRIP